MQPTSLAKALRILSDHIGKSVEDNREWLVQKANEIRRALWKIDSAREVYFKKGDQCECVQCFPDDCTACAKSFVGITLPHAVTALYSLSVNGKTINMRVEPIPSVGCCSACGCLKAEKLVENLPLKNPIPTGYKGVLVFKVKDKADKRKRIGIEYVAHSGRIIREDVLGSMTGAETSQSVLRVLALTFPDRCGWISVQTEQAYELGSYHPSVMSPSHMVVKLQGVRRGDVVKWSGLVEPMDVLFDSDVVEFSNPLDWRNFYQLLDLHFKTGKSNAEQRSYQDSLGLAKSGMDADLASTRGIPVGNLRPKGIRSLRRQIRAITG